jgi:rhodanese-related sulfurtransferase
VLVEVLAPKYFRKHHLPGAINVPLDDHFDEQIQKAVPDKQSTVVVYCADAECQASFKAAQRMDELGYQHVLDYEAGKSNWQESGLPVEK